jgi:hypothetical protein
MDVAACRDLSDFNRSEPARTSNKPRAFWLLTRALERARFGLAKSPFRHNGPTKNSIFRRKVRTFATIGSYTRDRPKTLVKRQKYCPFLTGGGGLVRYPHSSTTSARNFPKHHQKSTIRGSPSFRLMNERPLSSRFILPKPLSLNVPEPSSPAQYSTKKQRA